MPPDDLTVSTRLPSTCCSPPRCPMARAGFCASAPSSTSRPSTAARRVARQAEDERAFIEASGGVVGPLYEENDTSAYRKKRVRLPDGTLVYRVVRPVWQRMLADLRAGVIGAACVADLDRLARDP